MLKFKVADAFTNDPFCGNPAAVIVLPEDHGLPDSTLLGIAAEFNISETAYVTIPKNKNSEADQKNGYVSLGLRWFTPTEEMPLCGHATIASSSVVFADETIIPPNINEIHFSTLSGIFKARRILSTPPKYELEFPAAEITPANETVIQTVSKAVEAATNPQVRVKNAGISSTHPYKEYIVVEIDETVPLKQLKVNTVTLVSILSVQLDSQIERGNRAKWYLNIPYLSCARRSVTHQSNNQRSIIGHSLLLLVSQRTQCVDQQLRSLPNTGRPRTLSNPREATRLYL